MLFLLAMFHFLYLLVHYSMQSGLRGFWIIVVCLFEKGIPELNLCLLLSPHLLINLMSYLFWLNVSVVDHAVRAPLFALSLLQKSL